jgi:membrane protein
MPVEILKKRYKERVLEWLRSTMLFKGTVSLYDILVILIEKLRVYNIDQRATSVAFSLTLASFPAVIFLFTLIPYIPIANLDDQIMEFLSEVIPKGIYAEVSQTILDIVSRPRKGVLSIGFATALITATNGMVSLMRSFNVVYKARENRGFFKTRGIAILLTLFLALVMIVSIVLLIVGDRIMFLIADWDIVQEEWIINIVNITRYVITFATLALGVSLIYRFAPNKYVRIPFFNPGSVIASALIVLATYGFSFYFSNFSSYNKLYGSIGTMIALMIWIYLIALLLILGFEINASIISGRSKSKVRTK